MRPRLNQKYDFTFIVNDEYLTYKVNFPTLACTSARIKTEPQKRARVEMDEK